MTHIGDTNCQQCKIDSIKIVEQSLDSTTGEIVEPLVGRSQLKQLSFENCVTYNRRDQNLILLFLRMIAPLSRKQMELNIRLRTEITDEMKKMLQLWQIEKIEKKIKDEIDLKYTKKFDENELTYDENDNNKNKRSDSSSSIEMLSMQGCSFYPSHSDLAFLSQTLTAQRVESSLGNLRAFAFDSRMTDRSRMNRSNMYDEIAVIILNSICNRLESLHTVSMIL